LFKSESLIAYTNIKVEKRLKTVSGLSAVKKLLFKFAGRKFDKMAAKRNQKYYFLFVESNGSQLERISKISIVPSIDEVFELKDVNKALKKVDNGGSKGKTLIKIG
jgi:hypothetical protein